MFLRNISSYELLSCLNIFKIHIIMYNEEPVLGWSTVFIHFF